MPKVPPRLRPYWTIAPSSPKTAPEAPIVKGIPARFETMKPMTPPTVKITTRRARPNSASTGGASWRTHIMLKRMCSRLPWR